MLEVGVEGLVSIITNLKSQDPALLGDDELINSVTDLRMSIDRLEVEWIRRVNNITARRLPEAEGYSSTTALLKHRCRMSAAHALNSVALGDKLSTLQYVEKAFDSGDLSFDQAKVLAALPQRLVDQLGPDEVTLVNAISPLSVDDSRRVVEYWKAAVDGPGYETDCAELFDRRYLFGSKTLDGMLKLDGLLDPMTGDLVMTALQAATPPRREGDDRTPRQRRADALADLARTFLDSGEAPGTEKPHVVVLTDLDALKGLGGGVHETATGHVLTPEQVRQTACDATVSRVVFGPDSEPVDIGRATRVVPPAMRRALVARDRHCRHPGCDRPSQWCDAHHVSHWADGGPTALWNLKLLCRSMIFNPTF